MDGDVGGIDELHLLGLAVAEGDSAIEVIEVEVVEGFLGDLGRGHGTGTEGY